MRAILASSWWDPNSVVLHPDQGVLRTNQKLSNDCFRSFNSNTHLNRTDETRGKLTIEVSDLWVSDKHILMTVFTVLEKLIYRYFSCSSTAFTHKQKLCLKLSTIKTFKSYWKYSPLLFLEVLVSEWIVLIKFLFISIRKEHLRKNKEKGLYSTNTDLVPDERGAFSAR